MAPATSMRLAALVILTLGLAGASAIGSVTHRLNRLPHVAAPEQLVHIAERGPDGEPRSIAPGLFGPWIARSPSLVALAGYDTRPQEQLLVSDGRSAIVQITDATRNFFDVLGVTPTRGRTGEIGLVLSHDFWLSHFEGDERIVGRAVALQGVMGWRVLAIAPPGFGFPSRADMWKMGFTIDDLRGERRSTAWQAIARKRAGVSDRQVVDELTAMAAALPATPAVLSVTPATSLLGGPMRRPLLLLSVYSVAFLLVALAGTVYLESMRSLAAVRERAIRLALGASPRSLVAHALRQAMVISLAAGLLAAVLGSWIVSLLVRVIPQLPASPGASAVSTASTVSAVSAALGPAAAEWPLASMLFGISLLTLSVAAIWNVRDAGVSAPLLLAGHSSTSTFNPHHAWMHRMLIVLALAGTTSVAVCTVAATRHHARELLPDLGWDASRVIAASVAYPILAADHRPGQHAFDRYLATTMALSARVAALPGASHVSVVERPLFMPAARRSVLRRPDRADRPGMDVAYEVVGPAFFATLGVPIARGREFTEADRLPASILANTRAPRGPGHIVLSRAAARRLWGDTDPIGRRLLVDETFFTERIVVGLVDDLRLRPVAAEELPVAYVPYREEPFPSVSLLVRFEAPRPSLAREVLEALRSAIGPGEGRAASHGAAQVAGIGAVEPAVEAYRRVLAPPRAIVLLYVTIAAMTLTICLLGISAAVGHAVRLRRREWAVRLALGDQHAGLIRRVTTDGLPLFAAGIALGGVAAWASVAVVRAMVTVTALTAIDVAAGCGVVLALALAASYRAARPIRRANLVTLLHPQG